MSDCLVIKLSGSAGDNTLPELGHLVFEVMPSTTMGTQLDALFKSTELTDIKCTGDVGVYRNDYTTPYTPLPSKQPYGYVKGGDNGGTISYSEKYTMQNLWLLKIFINVDLVDLFKWCPLEKFTMNARSYKNLNLGQIFRENLPTTLKTIIIQEIYKADGQEGIDIESFKRCSSLNVLRISGYTDRYNDMNPELSNFFSNFYGDISSLSEITTLTELNIAGVATINGNIASLGTLTNLTKLTSRINKGINGSLEDMLDAMVANGRVSGTLTCTFQVETGITYGGSTIGTSTLSFTFSDTGWVQS